MLLFGGNPVPAGLLLKLSYDCVFNVSDDQLPHITLLSMIAPESSLAMEIRTRARAQENLCGIEWITFRFVERIPMHCRLFFRLVLIVPAFFGAVLSCFAEGTTNSAPA